jgi:asparagine synthase (glutamine-hydrolysing)
MQQSPVKAFTISFDHDTYDEAAVATEMAMTTSADHEILRLTAAELYGDSFVRTAWHAERTFYNTLGVAKWHMSRRVRECGFKVVVTGEGSDEMYAGYPFFKRDYFLHAPEARAESKGLLARMDASNDAFKGAILSESAVEHPAMNELCGFTPSWIQPWMLALEDARGLFAPRAREELEGYDPVAAIAAALDPDMLRGRHALDKAQYTWIKTMLEGQILNWGGDRVDMANSMESRPPFLDHLLAEHATRIPPRLRIRNGTEKWVLREAMKGVLPTLLYEREKFAFMAPPGHTDARKRAAMQTLAADYLDAEHLAAVGLFDRRAVDAFLERVLHPRNAVQGFRDDILFNHLVGLHILHDTLVAPAV